MLIQSRINNIFEKNERIDIDELIFILSFLSFEEICDG